MHDQNFSRTVIVLVEHGDQGSLGFVINRQLNGGINEVVEDMPPIDAPVFVGGPVERSTLHYIHTAADLPDARYVNEGVYWGGDYQALKEWVAEGRIPPNELLFFVGYSGWSPGQLEAELGKKSWIIAPENAKFLFRPAYEGIWREILQSMGPKYQIISNYPVDPSLN